MTIAMLAVGGILVTVAVVIRPRPEAPSSATAHRGRQRIQGRPSVVRPSQIAVRATIDVQPIYSDDVIETDDVSRVGTALGDGSSIRIDRGSRIRFLTPVALEIIAGAAYVATSDRSQGFEVRTTMGNLRDLGTQFEVRMTPSSLRLRVDPAPSKSARRQCRYGRCGYGSDGHDKRHRRSCSTCIRIRVGVDDRGGDTLRDRGAHACRFLEHLAAEAGMDASLCRSRRR